MVTLADKPDASFIQAMVMHLTRVWSDAHSMNRTRDTYYDRTFDLWPRGVNRPILHPAKPRAIIDHAVDQIMASEPKVERFGEDEAKKEEADSVEKALRAIFRQASLLEPSPTFKQALKHLILYGYTVIEDDLDSTSLLLARASEPVQGRGQPSDEFDRQMALWRHRKQTVMPFRIKAPHPGDVLMDPMRKDPRVAIRVDTWYSQDLVEITRAKKEMGRGTVELFEPLTNPFAPVTAYNYWTEDWHALLTSGTARSGGFLGFGGTSAVPGQLLIVEPNSWGFVPLSHAFSGRGNEPSDRSIRNPRYLAVGMLDHLMDDLKAQAQDMSAKHNMLLEAAFMPMGTTENAAEVEAQLARGEIAELPQGRASLWYVDRPTLPRNIQDVDRELAQDIEEGSYTRAIAGIKIPGISTVGQQAQISQAGHLGFITLGEQMNHLATKSGEHILQWVDVENLHLRIEGHEIKRSLIGSDYTVKVTFNVVDPVFQLQERELGLREVQAGTMALETFWSVSGRDDATGERERLAEDLVYAHPVIQAEFVKVAAERVGLAKLLAGSDTPGPGGASGAPTGVSPILGPDGQPLATTLGTGNGTRAGRELRQPLTGNVTKPSRTGQNLAG